MLLALAACTIVVVALLWEVAAPRAMELIERRRAARRLVPVFDHDPGRERRAEHRARALLKSCVDSETWEMYRDLGFIRVWGRCPGGPGEEIAFDRRAAPYAYLIYPHKPIVAYVPQTSVLLSEYCVEFPDLTRPYGSALLPDSDDVLAKWMALTGDERRVISSANMHLPGRLIDPNQVRRDLWRLRHWERERIARRRDGAGSVRAS